MNKYDNFEKIKNTMLEVISLQQTFNDNTNGIGWENGVTKFGKKIDWILAMLQESSETIDSLPWKHWKNIEQKPDMENIRMETIDNLHFIISHLLSNYDNRTVLKMLYTNYKIVYSIKNNSNFDTFEFIYKIKLFMKQLLIVDLSSKDEINFEQENMFLIKYFFDIAHYINFKWMDLYQLYISKNCLNTFRQNNGYKEGTYIKNWGIEKIEDNVIVFELLKNDENLNYNTLYTLLDLKYKDMNK